jgi:trimeric autotransporter adhesin
MRKIYSLLVVASLLFAANINAQISVSGGSGLAATYSSLTNAGGLFEAINATAQTGNTIVVSITGDMLSEAGTNSLNAGAWTSITISPSGGAARTISGSPAGGVPIINLNGADNITINGLNSGGNTLTISNTAVFSTAGTSAIRFIGDASNNLITNCTILGRGTGTTNGVIFFSTASAGGNDNNTISNNTISAGGGSVTTNLIYSAGTLGQENSGNLIQNNNFVDWFLSAGIATAVLISSNSTAWTISGNSFYQTASRTGASPTTITAINIANPSGSGFNISNNFIGGSAASCGGSALTLTGSGSSNNFRGIVAAVAASPATSIQGNTIRNIFLNTQSSNVFEGISVSAGNVNIGNVTGNTIGLTTASGSTNGGITMQQNTSTNGVFNGIINTGSGTVVIGAVGGGSNTIAGVTLTSASNTLVTNFYGIRNTGAANVSIANNLIGSTTNSDNITSNQASTGGTNASLIYGISQESTVSAAVSVIKNTIANLSYTTSSGSSAVRIWGINNAATTTSTAISISENTIFNIRNNSPNSGSGSTASVMGILNSAQNANITLNANVIYNLRNSNTTATTNSAIGIRTLGNSSSSLTKNVLFAISSAVSSVNSQHYGIQITGGTWNINNNMIRLGIDIAGTAISGNFDIQGINASSGTCNIYHNTVFIGGTGTGGSQVTLSVQSGSSSIVKNNILINRRTSSTANTNAALRFSGTGSTAQDGNIYYVDAVNGGVLAKSGATDYATIAALQAVAPGRDVASIAGDPLLVSPTAGTPNLKLNANSPADGTGVSVTPAVTEDFENEVRSGLTPVDIGADAGIYTAALDAGIQLLASPLAADCPNPSQAVVVRLRNNGSAILDMAVNNVPITVNITGAITQTLSNTLTTGTLAPGATLDVNMGTISTTTPGSYTYTSFTSVVGDGNSTNDQNITNISLAALSASTSGAGPVCVGDARVLIATPTGGKAPYTYVWTPGGATVNTITVFPNADVNYSVTVTDACGAQVTPADIVLTVTNVPVYASLPYTTSFEDTWTSACATRERPGNNWSAFPNGGGNSWRRDDDGVAGAAWANNSGNYTPSGSNGMRSARFHSFQTSLTGELRLYIDASTPGTKTLTFDYINTSGSDKLQVFQSTDGGVNFTQLGADITTAATWTAISRSVTSTSATTILRFLATGDNGSTDLGIDNLSITLPCTGTPSGGTASALATGLCTGASTIATTTGSTLGGSITYQWQVSTTSGSGYTNVTGGSGATSTSYTLPTSLAVGTYYYVLNVTCGNSGLSTLSSEVAITVSTPPVASASSNSPVCVGGTLNLTGNPGTGTSFAWTGVNSFSSTLQSPSITSVTTLAAGQYSFTSTLNGCVSNIATINVGINPAPTAVGFVPASPVAICSGTSASITANGGIVSPTQQLGTGTSTTVGNSFSSTLGPNPLSNYYGGIKQQVLVTAAELTALGMATGSSLTAIAFNMPFANTAYTLNSFKVSIQHTALTALTSTFVTSGWTDVRTAAGYNLTGTGWNTISFNNSFTWDGTSNLLIQTTYSNANAGITSSNNTAQFGSTTPVTTTFYRVDNASAAAVEAATTATYTYTSRNNIRFSFTQPVVYTWAPASTLNTNTGATVTASPNEGTIYTVTATSGSCTATGNITVTGNVFTGTGNWNDVARWSCGNVPANGDLAIIGAGANASLNQDVTISGKLSLNSTASLTILPQQTLSIGAAGVANFNGASVTVQSTAAGTGSIGQITGTLNGASNVTIERFIPDNGFRSWRLLAVPTKGTQTIRNAWQEGVANPNPLDNNLPGRGTQITGTGTLAAAQAAGFDNVAPGAALLTYNQAGNNWVNVPGTNTPIETKDGYFLYIRGAREQNVAPTINNPISSPTTLRSTGEIYQGSVTSNQVSAGKFATIGNIYPSRIDFTQLSRTGGVDNKFYIWDSKKLNGTKLGVYQTFTSTNNFRCLIGGGSYVLLSENNTQIEHGQAFIVQSSSTAGTVNFTEAAKISGSTTNGFRPATPTDRLVSLTTSVLVDGDVADANEVVFADNFANEAGKEDAAKLANPGINFAVVTNNETFAVEGRKPVADGDIIAFKMWNMQARNYKLQLSAANLAIDGLTAVLEDAYTGTKTPLNLAGVTTVNFTVDATAASAAEKRFRVVFGRQAIVPGSTATGFTVMPNPASGKRINVEFSNQAAGKYTFRLTNISGKQVYSTVIGHAGNRNTYSIAPKAALAAGTYTLEVLNEKGERTAIPVMVAY